MIISIAQSQKHFLIGRGFKKPATISDSGSNALSGTCIATLEWQLVVGSGMAVFSRTNGIAAVRCRRKPTAASDPMSVVHVRQNERQVPPEAAFPLLGLRRDAANGCKWVVSCQSGWPFESRNARLRWCWRQPRQYEKSLWPWRLSRHPPRSVHRQKRACARALRARRAPLATDRSARSKENPPRG